MNYDFHIFNKFIPLTGFNAPLRSTLFEIFILGKMTSVSNFLSPLKTKKLKDYSTRYWLNNGINQEKLIFGIPTYGRGYKLLSSTFHKIYSPAVGYSDFGDSFDYKLVYFFKKQLESKILLTFKVGIYFN